MDRHFSHIMFHKGNSLEAPYSLGATAQPYEPAQAQIALMLSNVAYCGGNAYSTYNYTGVLAGFQFKYKILSRIVDDTEGLVGILPSDKSIYIALRGSTNI